jgi:hypothetical protein
MNLFMKQNMKLFLSKKAPLIIDKGKTLMNENSD